MILFVDMEHPDAARRGAPCDLPTEDAHAARHAYLRDVQTRLEACSRESCVVRRYDQVTESWIRSHNPRAVVLSGNVTDWDVYEEGQLQPLKAVVRRGRLPILGLCGGIQFIALAHGAAVAPMRRLTPGERDLDSGYAGGYAKEWGYTKIKIVSRDDPLFRGLVDPVFLEAHYCEVREVPEGFELLASTDACRVQAMRRQGTLVYGTQFHPETYIAQLGDSDNCLIQRVYPEGYRARHPEGRTLLVNFFRLAGLLRGSGPEEF